MKVETDTKIKLYSKLHSIGNSRYSKYSPYAEIQCFKDNKPGILADLGYEY